MAPSLHRGRRRLVVVWRVAEACDLDCSFCGYARSRHYVRVGVDPSEVMRFCRVMTRWADEADVAVVVSWLGGEPLIWKPLYATSCRVRALGIRTGVTTNGANLHRPSWTPERLAA